MSTIQNHFKKRISEKNNLSGYQCPETWIWITEYLYEPIHIN